jgi:hypothetical protein
MPDNDNVRNMWSEDELDQALAALQPTSEPDERAFSRARTELLLAAGARESAADEPPTHPRRRWGWWTAATATVAAVVAAVLVVQTVQSGDNLPSAAAVEGLNSAANKINSVDEPLAPGQYRYIATHAWWMSIGKKYSYLAENLLETWVPADEKQDWLLRRDVTGKRKWISGTEEEAKADGIRIDDGASSEGEWRAPCGDWYAENEGKKPCTTPGTWQTPNNEFMAALPRNPDQLYNRLRNDTAGHGSDENLEMLAYVADLLRSGLTPADLRATLYRTLAKIPTLEITEQVANLDNQKGTAYGISTNEKRQDVIIDPTTGQFIGERQITEEDYNNLPAGTVIEYTSVTTTITTTIGKKPN